ncbi:MAG: FeoB-associated Cys-rich membrane protein [Methanomassiliicoccaceae archaeon]|nr:FeoB-associated Cys-rich membrane protein [Methanomassiliicoccaceae archaeon]
MLNAATLAIGLAVLLIIAFSAYYTYRSLKRGGCAGCSGCPDTGRGADCGQCPKKRD